MSAIGHTMATMGRNGGKPSAGGSASASNENARRRPAHAHGGQADHASSTAASRGQNINHLLAFTLPPRVPQPSAPSGARRPRRGGGRYVVPFNKERYVNAQYRFLVKPTGDYTAYFADADIFLNWSDILIVLIPTTSALSTAHHVSSSPTIVDSAPSTQPALETHEGAACPICLSPPTAPRMTKCGHVYCYPCILHYLTVNDAPAAASGSTTPTPHHHNQHHHVPGAGPRTTPNSATATPNPTLVGQQSPHLKSWKRCPVCWDAVYARDLKAVQWWDANARAQEFEAERNTHAQDHEGQSQVRSSSNHLCMRLIERPHLTNLALPKSTTWPTASTSTSDQPLIAQHAAPWHFQPDVMTFSKFMLATPDQLLANLNSDLEQLSEERQLLQSFSSNDESGLLFVGMAERKVMEQMEKVTNELDTQSVRSRIGYARKELAEHHEMEKGIRRLDAESVSRRQRKRMERERRNEANAEAGTETETKENATVERQGGLNDGAVDDAEGMQAFLATQSQNQGGQVGKNTYNQDDGNQSGDVDSAQKESRVSGPKTRRNLNPPAPSLSSFFFYQASSGQNIFLHPLDIKILLNAFGSYAAFPETLDVYVQGADEGSMNEEMRKRCKYLTHLSKGADIVFIEVDWDKMLKEDHLSACLPMLRSTLKPYEQALRQRRNRRRDRERREDRAKTRSEEHERVSRPAPMTTHPIGIGGLSRSPNLSAYDAFGSSLGSQDTASPLLQEALLQIGSDAASLQSDEEFPVPLFDGTETLEQDETSRSIPSTTRNASRRSNPGQDRALLGSSKTVWGTPAAANGNSFANALHKSSRATGMGQMDEAGADWDAWLELEEDFIVGARNNSTIREGRGLNKQAKRGEHATVNTAVPSSSPNAGPREVPLRKANASISTQASDDGGKETDSATNAPKPVGGKQQKKKKLVLTSGGGGRGTR